MATSDKLVNADGLKVAYDANHYLKITDPAKLTWVVGKQIRTTYPYDFITNNKYVALAMPIFVKAGSTINCASGYTFNAAIYGDSQETSSYVNIRTSAYTVANDCWMRFGIREAGNVNNASVQTDDTIKSKFILDITSDTMNNVLADAVKSNAAQDVLIDSVVSTTDYMRGYGAVVDGNSYVDHLTDLNDAQLNKIYFLNQLPDSVQNIPDDEPTPLSGTLVTFSARQATNQTRTQLLVSKSGKVWVRSQWIGTWGDWIAVYNDQFNNEKYYLNTCVDRTKTKLESGDKFIVFGDSIANMNWPTLLANATGATVVKRAVAGAGFARDTAEKQIITQVNGTTSEQWADVKLVFVAGGVNDAGFNTGVVNVKTAVQDVIDAIKTTVPNAHIVFITPIRPGASAATVSRIASIAGVIGHVALINGCSVINGFDFPIPVNDVGPYTENDETKYLIERQTAVDSETGEKDHLHPSNDVGQAIYSRSVINAIM